jgi:hypothetical protein
MDWADRLFGRFPWPIFVTIFWGIGLMYHTLEVYRTIIPQSSRHERAVQHNGIWQAKAQCTPW